MAAFLRRHALLYVALAGLGWWLAVIPRWIERIAADPLDVPLPVETGGHVEQAITIPIHSSYGVSIAFDRAAFERDGGSYEDLKRLVGGRVRDEGRWPFRPGAPVPIRWAVHDPATGARVAAGERADGGAGPPQSTGWSRDEVTRGVGGVTLAPGRYVFRAEVLAPAPALVPLRPRLILRSGVKDSGGGAGATEFAAAVVTDGIVWPAFVIALLYLAAAAVAAWRGAERRAGAPTAA